MIAEAGLEDYARPRESICLAPLLALRCRRTGVCPSLVRPAALPPSLVASAAGWLAGPNPTYLITSHTCTHPRACIPRPYRLPSELAGRRAIMADRAACLTLPLCSMAPSQRRASECLRTLHAPARTFVAGRVCVGGSTSMHVQVRSVSEKSARWWPSGCSQSAHPGGGPGPASGARPFPNGSSNAPHGTAGVVVVGD